jgi:hypothetical protein
MRLTLIAFLFFFNQNPIYTQENTTVVRDASDQVVDTLISTCKRFLKKILPPPFTEEQFNKILKIKMALAAMMFIGMLIWFISEVREDWKERQEKRKNKKIY